MEYYSVLKRTELASCVKTWAKLFFFFNTLLRTAPVAYGIFQARGQIRAAAASLHHSHSNARSEPHLRPTPPLTATPDP